MAKVTAPLFSFGARGALAKSLVYMSWKGIDDVRSYVVPANPQSSRQVTQRGYFTAAVAAYHDPLRLLPDLQANDIAARFSGKPQSGFNLFTADIINQEVAGLGGTDRGYIKAGTLSYPDPTHFDFTGTNNETGTGTHQGKWGYSPSKLDNAVDMVFAAGAISIAAPILKNDGMPIFLSVPALDDLGDLHYISIYTL